MDTSGDSRVASVLEASDGKCRRDCRRDLFPCVLFLLSRISFRVGCVGKEQRCFCIFFRSPAQQVQTTQSQSQQKVPRRKGHTDTDKASRWNLRVIISVRGCHKRKNFALESSHRLQKMYITTFWLLNAAVTCLGFSASPASSLVFVVRGRQGCCIPRHT